MNGLCYAVAKEFSMLCICKWSKCSDNLLSTLYMWNCNLLGPCWEIPLISSFYTLKFTERWPLIWKISSHHLTLSLIPYFLLFAPQHPTFSLWLHSPPSYILLIILNKRFYSTPSHLLLFFLLSYQHLSLPLKILRSPFFHTL